MAKVYLCLEDYPSGIPNRTALRVSIIRPEHLKPEDSNALRVAKALHARLLDTADRIGGAVIPLADLKEEGE